MKIRSKFDDINLLYFLLFKKETELRLYDVKQTRSHYFLKIAYMSSKSTRKANNSCENGLLEP
jgi:hypothetical protein